MAEEQDNKPKVRVIKKAKAENSAPEQKTPSQQPSQNQSSPAAVVIRKKKVVVVAASTPEKPSAPDEAKKVAAVAPAANAEKETKEKPAQETEKVRPVTPVGQASAPEKKIGTVGTKGTTQFVLNQERPNSKQGNLADHGRGSRQGGQFRNGGNYRDGANRGGFEGRQRTGGFTGAQAREGFQNRDRNGQGGNGSFNGSYAGRQGRDGQRPFGNRDGQNRPFGNRNGAPQGGRPGFGGNQQKGSFAPRTGGGFASPMPMEENRKASSKKTASKKKTVYSKKDREEEFDDSYFLQKKKQTVKTNPVPEKIDIMESVSVSDLAKKMNLKASDIIAKLMSMGMMVTVNQSIDADTATLLASEYGCEVHIISLYEETVIERDADDEKDMLTRPPVVTVMGHVDHGKTKTLDAIRHANVAEGEAGGITQSIGAYSVSTPKGNITFLDTPGHEAFTMMRARGAAITDIVVLVVAADDGVMPQTIEAINHAKDAKVPIVVAVNKIDKPEANPDRVMTQLSELGLMPEEWGGDTQFVKISAKQKLGIEDLLEAILLQAEILELKANWNCRAEGKVIESRTDHGRGVVSTIIVERGTLRIGDPYVAGIYSGRVRAIFNDRGQKIKEATPSMPVEILGLEAMPMAGDPFQVTDSEKTARDISNKRQELKRFEAAKAVKKVNLDNLYETIDAGEVTELKVVIKADLQGSAEALKTSLEKLSTKEIRLVVIHSSAGAINESDVLLAAADSNAIIIGFNVRPTPRAKLLADQEKVDIRKYNVIYKCVEEITQAMEGMLKPDVKEEVAGMIEVRDTFKVPKVGTIAGCYVTQGTVKRSSTVNIIRDGIVIHSGKIASLKRFKDDAKEVATGFECGISIENWQDIQVGDQFEIIEYVEVARKLGDTIADEKASEEKEAGENA